MAFAAALGKQLLDAACDNDAWRVRDLLAAGEVGVNYKDGAGFTALICASAEGHAEIFRALLAVEGIDTNHANTEGFTALILASQEGRAEVVRDLLAVDGINAPFKFQFCRGLLIISDIGIRPDVSGSSI